MPTTTITTHPTGQTRPRPRLPHHAIHPVPKPAPHPHPPTEQSIAARALAERANRLYDQLLNAVALGQRSAAHRALTQLLDLQATLPRGE